MAPKNNIPLAVPTINGNEWDYIRECLDTNWVSYLGPYVSRFETELAERCGSNHAVATASGTAALHLALLLSGVEADSEVVMPAMTFVAPANAVRYCGAWPTLIDLHKSDWQIDTSKLDDFLANHCQRRNAKLINKATGRTISALLPVHILGDMCDVDSVADIAARYDLPIVEDAAECLGATYKGRLMAAPLPGFDPARRCVITSFNGNKVMTTGGGGALFSDDKSVSEHAKHLATTAKSDRLRFVHDEIGYNYRLTNVAAAMGVAQLEQLADFLSAKRSHAKDYAAAFQECDQITLHPESRHTRSAYWLYTVMTEKPSWPIIEELNSRGIMVRPSWTPINRLPKFRDNCFAFECQFSEKFAQHAVSLPSSVSLTGGELATVVNNLLELA